MDFKDEIIGRTEEFHRVFKLGIETKPTNITKSTYDLRYHLMKEENEEYLAACENNDLVEIGDALGDMLYVLCGTMVEHGFQSKIEAIFQEIHRSNMSKLDENGQPIYRADGKVIKSNLFFKPNIQKILLDD